MNSASLRPMRPGMYGASMSLAPCGPGPDRLPPWHDHRISWA